MKNKLMTLKFDVLYFIYGLLTRLSFCKTAFSKINQPHIGRYTVYNGENCRLRQSIWSNNVWSMKGIQTGNDYKMPIVKTKLDSSFRAKYNAFKFHYRFLMSNWLTIYVMRKMEKNTEDAWLSIVGHRY